MDIKRIMGRFVGKIMHRVSLYVWRRTTGKWLEKKESEVRLQKFLIRRVGSSLEAVDVGFFVVGLVRFIHTFRWTWKGKLLC